MLRFREMFSIVQFIVVLNLVGKISSRFEFTNIKCETFDSKFNDFEYCFLKSVNRTYKYASVKTRLYQTPVTSVQVQLALYQRHNGYSPFLYNLSVDACRFLANQNKFPVAKYFYQIVEPFTNMNHKCPYNDDLFIDKLPVDFVNNHFTSVLPFPRGDYMLETNWLAYNIKRAVVKFYGTLS